MARLGLIDKVRNAVAKGELLNEFCIDDVKNWIAAKNITQSNGRSYAKNSIKSILSNSDMKNERSSNKNKKVLTSKRINGIVFYQF